MKKESLPNVIMLTAFGQEDVTKKAVDLGASYFIFKPFDMENLSKSYSSGKRQGKSSITKTFINN